MKTKLFAAWLCLTLVSAAMAVTLDTGGNVEGKETILDEITYIISEPFRINNNTDFATSPKVTGGDGSAGNPWIIENYEIDGTGYGYCIYIGNTTEHFVVRDCLLHNASGHNEWPWFNNAGITLNNIVNGVFQNNTARECEYGYITIEWIRDLNFIKNNAFNNSRDGIRFLRGYNCTIHNNVANDNGNAGIAVLSSRQIRIENNTANDNGEAGIHVSELYTWGDSRTIQIMNNSALGNHYGLYMGHSYWSDVRNNVLVNNDIGLCFFTSENNNVFDNHVTNNSMGIIFDSSSINYLGGNSIINSTGMTGSSSYSIIENDLDVYQNDPNWSNYTCFEEQLATGDGGKTLFTRAVDLADTILFEVSITGHANAPDLDLGIFLDGKGGNPIDGITQTEEFVTYCADADADESVRLLAPEGGTYLIRVFGYTVTDNPGQFDIEINIVNASSTGIYLMNSSYNKIVNNNISLNSQGLNLTSDSDFNRLHYNNIADNIVQAFDDGANRWNVSYVIGGGNYWSDYAGTDAFSGSEQNETGPDGIGDTPYIDILGGGNEDAYPLMNHTDGVYIDDTSPISSAYLDADEPFWGYCMVSTHLDDDYSGIDNVVLWYRYSPDNQTWGDWTEFTFYDPGEPSWLFAPMIYYLGDEGYYEFYTIATDGAGNVETKSQVAETYWLLDNTAPQSHVLQPTIYWNIPDLNMEVSVTDNTNSTNNVEVFYRFSQDNATWGGWTLFENLTAEPWNFTFSFPDEQGYYQFYSRANDTSGNPENATATTQARIGYDITAPQITDTSPVAGTTGDAYTFQAQVTDNLELSGVQVIYWFGTGTETNATMVHADADNYELEITVPIGSLDMLHYRIAATDAAGNWNSTGIRNILIADNDDPTVNTGADQTVEVYDSVYFNGSASADNIGVVNYTWTFNDGIANVTIYGVFPNHTFTIPGNYTVTLMVRDAAGNSDADTMMVTVTGQPTTIDDIPPSANAGSDRNITAGTLVTFDGSTSTDNVGIGDHTWTFTHNGTAVILHGVSPTFMFWEVGNHTVTLNVTDTAGNWDTDSMMVTVNAPPIVEEEEEAGSYLWLVIVAVIVLAGVALGFWMMKKGRKPEISETEQSPEETNQTGN